MACAPCKLNVTAGIVVVCFLSLLHLLDILVLPLALTCPVIDFTLIIKKYSLVLFITKKRKGGKRRRALDLVCELQQERRRTAVTALAIQLHHCNPSITCICDVKPIQS